MVSVGLSASSVPMAPGAPLGQSNSTLGSSACSVAAAEINMRNPTQKMQRENFDVKWSIRIISGIESLSQFITGTEFESVYPVQKKTSNVLRMCRTNQYS